MLLVQESDWLDFNSTCKSLAFFIKDSETTGKLKHVLAVEPVIPELISHAARDPVGSVDFGFIDERAGGTAIFNTFLSTPRESYSVHRVLGSLRKQG